MMRDRQVNFVIRWTIIFVFAFVVVFNIYLIHSYFKLHTSLPLANFNGNFASPVSLSKDDSLVGVGTYNRDVICELRDFDIHLVNIKTDDEIVIGPRSLKKAPPVNRFPGKNIPIEFEVYIPESLHTGTWTAEFHGFYTCREGIFIDHITQQIKLSEIKVID